MVFNKAVQINSVWISLLLYNLLFPFYLNRYIKIFINIAIIQILSIDTNQYHKKGVKKSIFYSSNKNKHITNIKIIHRIIGSLSVQ